MTILESIAINSIKKLITKKTTKDELIELISIEINKNNLNEDFVEKAKIELKLPKDKNGY